MAVPKKKKANTKKKYKKFLLNYLNVNALNGKILCQTCNIKINKEDLKFCWKAKKCENCIKIIKEVKIIKIIKPEVEENIEKMENEK